jgi:peptidoglycan/LPS O-acetylase OafA/YrhL
VRDAFARPQSRQLTHQHELRRRDALCAACLGVLAYAAAMLVLSSVIDEPAWFTVCHIAVVLMAIGVVYGTLHDVATRSDWTPAQRASWRNWLWGFNLFAAAAYYGLHMRSR